MDGSTGAIEHIELNDDFAGAVRKKVFGGSTPPSTTPIVNLARAISAIYPEAKILVGDKGLTVLGEGENGFPVSVEIVGDMRVVHLGLAIAEFSEDDDVLQHVLLACSSECQLTVRRAGRSIRDWKLVASAGASSEKTLLVGGYKPLFSLRKLHVKVYSNDRPFRSILAA